jgi:hypothetical protein
MTLEEIRETLERSLPLRIPQFGPDDSSSFKIEQLEDYILKTALHRGDLEEALYWCVEAGKALRIEWEGIVGYESALPRGSSGRHTKEQVDRARRTMRPELWAGLQEARSLVAALERQVKRLGGSDYEAASRAYTMLTGS